LRDILPILRQLDAIKAIEDLRSRLRAIEEQSEQGGWYVTKERLLRWKESGKRVIAAHFKRSEEAKFERAISDTIQYEGLRFDAADGYLVALLESIERDPGSILLEDSPVEGPAPATSPERPKVIQTKRIFVVHGSDERNLLRLERLLKDRFGLEPVILRYMPGQGRTLIEKFEEEAEGCVYAIVLVSPDDQVVVTGSTNPQQYAQARPNVVFELGWFHGRLGRARVCILFKRGTKLHSDLEGISRIEFAENVEEKILEIEKELKAAGLLSTPD
jgi:hypothetical protein